MTTTVEEVAWPIVT